MLIITLMIVAHGTTNAATDAARGYIENKGQIGDQHGKPNHDVRFLIVRAGLNIQLRTNSFSYDSYTIDRVTLPSDSAELWTSPEYQDRPNEDVSYHFHRVDVELVGANPRPMITAASPSADYLNYYTHITHQVHGDEGATFVRGYARVTYHDVWPNIDVEWFLDEQERPEYQFIVRPGGDVSQIRLRYNGASDTRLVGEALELNVMHGTILERLPRSYVIGSDDRVDIRYRALSNDEYGFTEPPNELAFGGTLVIDPMPELLWATYYGGDRDDAGTSVAVTQSGEIVIAGSTYSSIAIATADANQTTIGGVLDSYLAAFTNTGTRRWATYYGGIEDDGPAAMTVTPRGEIALVGVTLSLEAIATLGAHQETHGGGRDAFLAIYTAEGTRRWSTYYGGKNDDRGFTVASTPEGHIVLAGTCLSSNGIATVGSHQDTIGGGRDAFAVVFSSTGTRLWGTYYGGSSHDDGNNVAVTKGGDIILSGTTYSQTAISTSGAYQENMAGQGDVFIVALSSEGSRKWATYFGGTRFDDCTTLCLTDVGDIVLGGFSSSKEAIATPGAHQETGVTDAGQAFLAVFSSTGSRLWGTYYGGVGLTTVSAVAVTSADNIVMAGSTSSEDAIAAPGAYQMIFSGGSDAFIAAFSSTGVRLWGTYYGGSSEDGVSGLAIAPNNEILIVGTTSSKTAISTEGAHQPLHGGDNSDAFLAKFLEDTVTSIAPDRAEQNTHTITSMRPNPAFGQTVVTVSCTSGAVLQLVDVLGRVHVTIPVAAGTTDTNISTLGLPLGSYHLRLVPIALTSNVQLYTQALIVVQ